MSLIAQLEPKFRCKRDLMSMLYALKFIDACALFNYWMSNDNVYGKITEIETNETWRKK